MAKSTTTYWNALRPENQHKWMPVKGLEAMAEDADAEHRCQYG